MTKKFPMNEELLARIPQYEYDQDTPWDCPWCFSELIRTLDCNCKWHIEDAIWYKAYLGTYTNCMAHSDYKVGREQFVGYCPRIPTDYIPVILDIVAEQERKEVKCLECDGKGHIIRICYCLHSRCNQEYNEKCSECTGHGWFEPTDGQHLEECLRNNRDINNLLYNIRYNIRKETRKRRG